MEWPHSTPYVCRLPNPGKQLYPPPIEPASVETYLSALAADPPMHSVGQLYIHLPFCESLCTFCPIFKELRPGHDSLKKYVDTLVMELQTLARQPFVQKLSFESVYFGGGTPSIFPEQILARIVNCIVRSFCLQNAQWTFEGHVRSLTRDKIRSVKSLGFNRISAGVQTFDVALRCAMNLQPTERDIRNCVGVAREEGFEDFNVDLMYNLPGQSLRIWESDLSKTLELNPSGIDVYEAVVAHTTPLYSQIRRHQLNYEQNPSLLSCSYHVAEQLLSSSGYRQRNIFAWDRPGFRNIILGDSKRLLYRQSHLVGAGLSAYSVIDGTPFMNHTTRYDYIRQVQCSGVGVMSYHAVTHQLRKQRFMIMSLHDMHLDRREYRTSFGTEMDADFADELESFRIRDLIQPDADGFTLTPAGRAWATTMSIEFYDATILAELLRSRLQGGFFIPSTFEEEYQLPIFAIFHPDLLLRSWSDYALIADFIAHLRRQEPGWSKNMFRIGMRSVLRWGTPHHLCLYRGFGIKPRNRALAYKVRDISSHTLMQMEPSTGSPNSSLRHAPTHLGRQ